ncbi:MAG: type II secretion system F family protein [Rickettsiales bacterium]
MVALFAALAIGIVSYFGFVIMFPKAMPEDSNNYVAQALDRLYEENRTVEAESGGILRDQLRDETPIIRQLFGLPIMRPLYEIGAQAGYQTNLRGLLIFMGACFAITAVVLLAAGNPLLAIIAAPLMAYGIPYRHCVKRVRRRNRKFIDQFPDALDMIVRSVRSGFPLSVSLQMLAENTEDPLRTEFRQVVDEVTGGRPLPEALARMASRMNEQDIRFFVVVLTVQQETGGNLAEIIGNLSNVLRKRKQLRHKIRAMTSEGRATGLVLGGLPIFVFGLLYFIQPDYLSPFFNDPLGHTFLGVVAGLMFVCYLVVKQMINMEV